MAAPDPATYGDLFNLLGRHLTVPIRRPGKRRRHGGAAAAAAVAGRAFPVVDASVGDRDCDADVALLLRDAAGFDCLAMAVRARLLRMRRGGKQRGSGSRAV